MRKQQNQSSIEERIMYLEQQMKVLFAIVGQQTTHTAQTNAHQAAPANVGKAPSGYGVPEHISSAVDAAIDDMRGSLSPADVAGHLGLSMDHGTLIHLGRYLASKGVRKVRGSTGVKYEFQPRDRIQLVPVSHNDQDHPGLLTAIPDANYIRGRHLLVGRMSVTEIGDAIGATQFGQRIRPGGAGYAKIINCMRLNGHGDTEERVGEEVFFTFKLTN